MCRSTLRTGRRHRTVTLVGEPRGPRRGGPACAHRLPWRPGVPAPSIACSDVPSGVRSAQQGTRSPRSRRALRGCVRRGLRIVGRRKSNEHLSRRYAAAGANRIRDSRRSGHGPSSPGHRSPARGAAASVWPSSFGTPIHGVPRTCGGRRPRGPIRHRHGSCSGSYGSSAAARVVRPLTAPGNRYMRRQASIRPPDHIAVSSPHFDVLKHARSAAVREVAGRTDGVWVAGLSFRP
jgi:hypothetical protein